MIAAFNKVHFPKLQRIRALGQSMLNALNKSDGPSGEDGGYVRYNRWSKACLRFGIRLDDCTGESLGTLPQDDNSEDESEDESGDERSDDDYDDDNDDDGGECIKYILSKLRNHRRRLNFLYVQINSLNRKPS